MQKESERGVHSLLLMEYYFNSLSYVSMNIFTHIVDVRLL